MNITPIAVQRYPFQLDAQPASGQEAYHEAIDHNLRNFRQCSRVQLILIGEPASPRWIKASLIRLPFLGEGLHSKYLVLVNVSVQYTRLIDDLSMAPPFREPENETRQ
jgi:hypothetical protein